MEGGLRAASPACRTRGLEKPGALAAQGPPPRPRRLSLQEGTWAALKTELASERRQQPGPAGGERHLAAWLAQAARPQGSGRPRGPAPSAGQLRHPARDTPAHTLLRGPFSGIGRQRRGPGAHGKVRAPSSAPTSQGPLLACLGEQPRCCGRDPTQVSPAKEGACRTSPKQSPPNRGGQKGSSPETSGNRCVPGTVSWGSSQRNFVFSTRGVDLKMQDSRISAPSETSPVSNGPPRSVPHGGRRADGAALGVGDTLEGSGPPPQVLTVLTGFQ